MRTKIPRYRLQAARRNFLFSLILSLFPLLISPCLAQTPAEETILHKYEQAVALAEELNVYQEDIFHILPKLRLAGQALLRGDFLQADQVLTEAMNDLRLVESKRPSQMQRAFRLEWLEIYREIIQKFAVIALLAYLFIKMPYFRRALRANRFTFMGRVYMILLTGIAAIFFSLFDLVRYGKSTWEFFDIQVVFLAIGGLLGGFWPGLLLGILVGLFRWFLNPDFLIYFGIALATGVLAGIAGNYVKNFDRTEKKALATGCFVGAVHGLAVTVPMGGLLPWPYLLMSILFLTAMEGVAVFIFFALVSGILREENQREVEKELLKTKLLFLQAQISPHFLYNALNTIAAICSRENATEARRLVHHLADLFRRTVKRYDDHVTFREEIDHIESYLEIEKARFQDRLHVIKSFSISDDTWSVKIPCLVFQPIVENAIKHGISKKEQGGTLEIKASEEEGCLKVEVVDDGVGAEKVFMEKRLVTPPDSEESGIGIQNIHERLVRLYGSFSGLVFECEPGRGMRVCVRIPLGERKMKGGRDA